MSTLTPELQLISLDKMTTKSQNQFATKDDLKKLETRIGRDIRGFRDEIKDYMGLLHEQFSDQVKVVAEQYTTIDKRLIRVESKTDMLVETVGEIKMEVAVMKEDMTEMKEDMTVMKSDMTEMKEDMMEMKEDMMEMRGDISELKTDMKEVKEELLPGATRKVDKLEHRVAILESGA